MVTFFAGEKEMNRTACICLLNCRPGEHEQRAACYHQREPAPYKIAEKVKVILKMYHRKNSPIVSETNPRGGVKWRILLFQYYLNHGKEVVIRTVS